MILSLLSRFVLTLVPVFLMICVPLCHAQDIHQCDQRTSLWKISAATFVAGAALDAISSWKARELNPILRGSDGRFGARGVSIKAAVSSGILVYQYFHDRHDGARRSLATRLNFAMGGVYAATAVHNFKQVR